MSVSENVKRVREAIAESAIRSGRLPEDITLVAAAKTQDAGMVRQAIIAGVDAVGENRVQEMLEKHALGAYDGVPLHFIGHLQSNKVRSVVGTCALIESVGSAELLGLIGKKARALGIVQNILIEVNIGNEPSKSGIRSENLPQTLDIAEETGGVRVLGLMAIPPASEKTGKYFDAMQQLFVDNGRKKYDNVSMRILSMGMSGSFAEAILAGSTHVRVGTAIFGERPL